MEELAVSTTTKTSRSQTSPAPKKVTLAELAAAAKVSVPTVSKVLNGRVDVAAETRQKIETVIRALGYERSKRRKSPHEPWLIDLVFSEFSPYAMEIMRGAEEAALANRCRIAVSAIPDAEKEAHWIGSLVPGRTDGVVLAFAELKPDHMERLKSMQVPVVIVDPMGHPDPRTPSVGVANWAGGLMATEHLIQLGHRRIGIICGRPAMLCNQARLDGYRAALDRAGIEADPALVFTGAHHHPTAFNAASAMLDLPNPPTAIFATNDVHAMGVYGAARRHGLTLPDDLSVIGFDDLPIAEWAAPPLTTMRQPFAQMAALAIRMVLGKESRGASPRVELSTELVVRESTAPPRPLASRLAGAGGRRQRRTEVAAAS
jgi:LacI family transcriptional regulator